jgi:adenosylhomocysteine nucleosidase
MKKIGIIGAMEMEVEALRSAMSMVKVVKKAGMDFCEGNISGVKAVVVQSGIGKVNAALCVQVLADVFQVDGILNTGVAGSLNKTLNIGDIVISQDAIHHDVDGTAFGYAPGEVPQLGVKSFPADPDMMAQAMEAFEQLELTDKKAVIGRVLSGDQFIVQPEKKQELIEKFSGDCVEMEGASVAQGAYLNGIPFVIIRAISDQADGSDFKEYPIFEKEAAAQSAALVKQFLTRCRND